MAKNWHMIEFKGISKQFGPKHAPVTALKPTNLVIEQGEIFGIIGKSGAGKSTLLRCMNLLEKPDSGQIFIHDNRIDALTGNGLRSVRRQIGMIFQHFNLLNAKNVFENIALPMRLTNTPKTTIVNKVNELMTLTNLTALKDRYPHQLSGGQKQRVAIARALVHEPSILLCDEATSALDPASTHAVLSLLKKVNQTLGVTVALITHEMEVIKRICDRVAVIEQGEIIELQSVIGLFTHPKTTISQALVKSAVRMNLPSHYKAQIHDSPTPESRALIRISYHGDVTTRPIITHLVQVYKLTVNIIQANMETIQDQLMGIMIVELSGDQASLKIGLSFLTEQGLNVEQLGYVR